ncbi:unnamed protein product [Dracunculus medinensis]|uniref:Secreted protein n=1 Tax=Dracunculus medinensis TaxID=318479 RepID=A0A0N4USD2_DRAME|nr:unnamed protein product [Dracunculus medinensis]
MLFSICCFAFLIHGVRSGDDKAIEDCNKAVEGQQRPTVEPGLCAHIDLPACAAIFPYNNAAATIATHANP